EFKNALKFYGGNTGPCSLHSKQTKPTTCQEQHRGTTLRQELAKKKNNKKLDCADSLREKTQTTTSNSRNRISRSPPPSKFKLAVNTYVAIIDAPKKEK
ncbi:hypothetical protein GOP47_0030962, partial [Adiantum capillus-veneris]